MQHSAASISNPSRLTPPSAAARSRLIGYLPATLGQLLFVLCQALLLALLLASPLHAAPVAEVEVFVRDGCPHCSAAKQFLAELQRERPELRIVLRPVDRDLQARDDLLRLSREHGHWPPGVPSFLIDGQLLVGFDEGSRAAQLRALLDARPAPPAGLDGGPLGTLSLERLGLPLFTLALGLLDGFNPCAMWVLLFLLSLLVHLRDRRRMALIAGTFVLVSGVVYYLFMAAWLNLFLAVGLSAWLTGLLGVMALLIGAINLRDGLRGDAFTFAIPDRAKPGLYARMRAVLRSPGLASSLAGVAVLAVLVNFIELLCTAGLPAIYTAVLTQQGLPPAAHYAYLGLYILGYIADDALMVALAVTALSSRKLSEAAGQRLKQLSGAVMLVLGLVMLLRPQWLLAG